jgi:hypothetical protein
VIVRPIGPWDEREQLNGRVASFLRPHLSADSLVAASEIDALGCFCDCWILDTVGLVSPVALAYCPVAPEDAPALNAIPEALIHDEEPEFFVSLEAFVRKTLLDDSWFIGRYDVIWRAETHTFGSDGTLVFRHHAEPSLP